MKLFITEKDYYVYEHWLDGQCFYVGKGSGTRAIQLGRNSRYDRFIKGKEKEVEVKIIKYFDTSDEAEEFERKRISRYKKEGKELVNIQWFEVDTEDQKTLIGKAVHLAAKERREEKESKKLEEASKIIEPYLSENEGKVLFKDEQETLKRLFIKVGIVSKSGTVGPVVIKSYLKDKCTYSMVQSSKKIDGKTQRYWQFNKI